MKSDDDPTHPNWDGITFQAATDHMGIVITPSSAQTRPPYTYLPVPEAVAVLGDLRAVIYGLEAKDPKSYLACFLEAVASDLSDAISACRPDPADFISETPHAPAPEVQGHPPG